MILVGAIQKKIFVWHTGFWGSAGNLKARDASVVFQSGDKVSAVASVGRNLENLKAELALERGAEFQAS